MVPELVGDRNKVPGSNEGPVVRPQRSDRAGKVPTEYKLLRSLLVMACKLCN